MKLVVLNGSHRYNGHVYGAGETFEGTEAQLKLLPGRLAPADPVEPEPEDAEPSPPPPPAKKPTPPPPPPPVKA